ncbi:MAG: hypothetical protein ACYC1C_09555 [Chloroflexota bacterium]
MPGRVRVRYLPHRQSAREFVLQLLDEGRRNRVILFSGKDNLDITQQPALARPVGGINGVERLA